MDSDSVVILGEVSSISVTKKPSAPDMLDVHFYTADEVRRGFSMTIGGARALWYRLTEILYPDAATQLTPRAATAAVRQDGPLKVGFSARVELLDSPRRLRITISGISEGWSMLLSVEEGYELWAYLSERCAPLASRDNS